MLHKMTPKQGSFTAKRLVGGGVRLDRLAVRTFEEHKDGPMVCDAIRDLPKSALDTLRTEFDIAPPA
jgi:hypothetical protein